MKNPWGVQMKKGFDELLTGKKIPIVVLDHNWHEIFQFVRPTKELKALEKKLNQLLKRQGKAVTESKDIKKIKKKLMNEIVHLMDELGDGNPDVKVQKKLDDNKRLINECNDKIARYEDELLELPALIDKCNKDLMLLTMKLCYEDIKVNNKDIKEIGEWISKFRVELKKQVLRKQDRETRNKELYRYLHGMFGPEVLDSFDLAYIPQESSSTADNIQESSEYEISG